MNKTSTTIEELSQRIESLEAQQESLLEALKLLLPLAIALPASTANAAQATKQLAQALRDAEKIAPRSEDFWYLASAMALTMSSRAVNQYPNDEDLVAIFQGLRANKRQ